MLRRVLSLLLPPVSLLGKLSYVVDSQEYPSYEGIRRLYVGIPSHLQPPVSLLGDEKPRLFPPRVIPELGLIIRCF